MIGLRQLEATKQISFMTLKQTVRRNTVTRTEFASVTVGLNIDHFLTDRIFPTTVRSL